MSLSFDTHRLSRREPTVSRKDWPAKGKWPKPGWKHALNHHQFRVGSVFGWTEDGYLWSGIVEETGICGVKVRDVLPGKHA